MSPARPERPPPFMPGLVPTLNRRGFMSESLDYFSARFVEYAAQCSAPVLDIGCAYGVATRAALERGARVHACDMEAGHVDILERETPAEQRGRLTTSVGELPGVDFPGQAFAAILCARVLHFLRGEDIRTAVRKMRDWLEPGGCLFLVADTPYSGFWFSGAPEYERRKAAGAEWPGMIEDIRIYLKDTALAEGMLPYLNPLDPDLLQRECIGAGLEVEQAAFVGREGSPGVKHHAGVIAVRRP